MLRDHKIIECPVSFITADCHEGAGYSTEMVRKWDQARRRKQTLSRFMESKSAMVEDVEDLFYQLSAEIEYEVARARERK